MELKGKDLLLGRLEALRLKPQRQRRLLGRMGRKVASASKKRITRQTDLQGRPFAPRSDGGKRKMLAGLRRQIRVRFDNDTAVISLPRGVMSRIGAEHQEGLTQTITARVLEEEERRQRRKRGSASGGPGNMATLRQAKRLKELGFRKPRKWIMANFNRRLAGFIIRKEEGRTPRRSWTVRLPARSFLGINKTDQAELIKMVRSELKKGLA